MDEVVGRMVSTQALLFLYMLVGFVFSKAGIILQDNRTVLVRLLMDVCVPAIVLEAFNHVYTTEEFRSSLVIILLSAVGCIASWAVGRLFFRKQPEGKKSVLLYATMFSNAGIAGLPVVSLVFGEVGVLYASMYLMIPRTLQWTLGVGLFHKSAERGAGLKNTFISPVMVSMYIGFVLMLTGQQIIGIPGAAISGLGGMTAPLSMILIGATLANMNLKMLFDRQVLVATVFRLMVIPLAFVMLFWKLGIEPLVLSVCVTLLAMPIATNTATIAERYGGDYVFASACVSVSTLLSVVTVPVITWITQSMY